MMLPDSNRAHVDRSKITEYLLSLSHPDGHTKAAFFMRFGFRVERWEAEALRLVGTNNPVMASEHSPHGVRYTVEGLLQAPDGRKPKVRTVWIVEPDSRGPRLITAHPG